MAAALQIVCVLFILFVMVFFLRRNKASQSGASGSQMALAVFQIMLCGWFFALCLSDVLDIKANFSYVRFVVNIFYAAAFLSISVYTLFYKHKDANKYLKGVIWAYIVLIAVQCFAFPYGTETEWVRVFESLEGAVVFGLLVALLFRLEDPTIGQNILLCATILELIVAVENVIAPFSSITDDYQLVDIPLNYAALFMRPVLFASLALAYRVWLNRRGQAIGRRSFGN